MKQTKSIVLCLFLFFLVIGCSEEAAQPAPTATTLATSAPTLTPALPEATNTPEPTAVPTFTPEPTPIIPTIAIEDQTLGEEGEVVVESITVTDPSWLVIFADENGIPGTVLGYAPVAPLYTERLTIVIDPRLATPILYAGLLVDAGIDGEFEYPGADATVEHNGESVIAPFAVTFDLPVPIIDIADQAVAPDGLLQVAGVNATSPNWLVIHTTHDGELGPAIGQIAIDAGQSDDLIVPIRWRDATTELAAALYEDRERPGGFDPSTDLPVFSAGEAVTARFQVQLPPDIFAYDQPVTDGKLQIEQVISETSGWIVVFNDNGGQPDRIIGFEQIPAGITRNLEMEIVETAATPQLFLYLHQETDNPAEFNFPASDPPATYNGEALQPTIVLTNTGNYLVTRDQTLNENSEVTIPMVITDLNTWLVIYTVTEQGQADEIVGQIWLPSGVNRDNRIVIPASLAGQPLLAVLHQDSGTEQEFDFPDGVDLPLQRNRQIVGSPFLLLERPDS